MATNGTTDGTAQPPEISIDLLEHVEGEQSPTATVSIPTDLEQTVRATVEPTDRGRWRCDFRVGRCPAAVSRTLKEGVDVGELTEWVTPVLHLIEALLTEVSC